MYLVTGATGHVGGAVARQLHERGHGVRALVRDPSGAASLPAGIELAAGDLDDPGSVSKAVAGAEFATRRERRSLPAVDSSAGRR
jgi:uncharacterized protein YbjT (DUF2867 family)